MVNFGVHWVNLGNTLSFWFNQSQFKIYGSAENSKIVNNKIQCLKVLLKQIQISKQIISNYRKHTQDLYFVAHVENIFIVRI